MVETIITSLASALCGGGLAMWLLQRWLNQKLTTAEKKKATKSEYLSKEYALEERYRHSVGRILFWMQRGMLLLEKEAGKTYWNGELAEAQKSFETVEAEMKELKNNMLASYHEQP